MGLFTNKKREITDQAVEKISSRIAVLQEYNNLNAKEWVRKTIEEWEYIWEGK